MFIYYNKTLNGCFSYYSLKTKEKSSWVIPKVVAVAYKRFSLQSVTHSSNRVSQRWSYLELVAYESGRKESFNCIHDQIYRALYWGTNMATGT